MNRYTFKGLTDESRLIGTIIEQSKVDEGEAAFLVRHNLERCVEVWDGVDICGYFLIFVKDKVRQVHGYKLCKGRARHALRIALRLLDEEKGVIYSGHREANTKVNRLLELLGFKEIGRMNNAVVMQKA